MLGASGLVGSSCYSKLLLDKQHPSSIVTVSRRKLNFVGVEERFGDLSQIKMLIEDLQGDAALCSIGSTMKKAKSREAFEEVDLNLPLRFAAAVKAQGAQSFHLVSSVGADPSSKQFYLRIKGLLETELRSIGFSSVHIYRPSLLLGNREEFRLSEELIAGFYRRFHSVYPKKLNHYRPIEVEKLSHFICRKIHENQQGIHIWENEDMLEG